MRVLILLLLLCAPCLAAPPDASGLAFRQHPGASVPLDVQFIDHTGQVASLRTLLNGRPAVLMLGYFHCPSLCGVVRDDAFEALSQTGLDTPAAFSVIDLSIDPHEGAKDAAQARDEDLARFPTPGAAEGWHFLTGAPEDLSAVTAAVGFPSRWDNGLQQFLHPAGLVFLTSTGIVSSYVLGVGYSGMAIRDALLKARAGTVAPAASPLLLLCFHYDSTTGKYSLEVVKLLRVGAALTLLLIAGLLVVIHRKRRVIMGA